MKLNEKQKLIALIAGFALLLVGECGFAYYCFAERGKHNATLDRLAQEEQDAERKIQEIPKLAKKSAELAAIIEEYAQILPRDSEVRYERFLEEIDEFARDAEIKIISAKDEKPVEQKANKKTKTVEVEKTFVRHTYRFELEGSFLGFLRFINRIENYPRFLRIDVINISGRAGKGKVSEAEQAENPVKSIELVISTYTYSQASTTGGEEAKK